MDCVELVPVCEKPEMGCIKPLGGAPLAMGWGSGGGADDTSGGETPTGSGGRGSGGTPERGAEMGAMGGIPAGRTQHKPAFIQAPAEETLPCSILWPQQDFIDRSWRSNKAERE